MCSMYLVIFYISQTANLWVCGNGGIGRTYRAQIVVCPIAPGTLPRADMVCPFGANVGVR